MAEFPGAPGATVSTQGATAPGASHFTEMLARAEREQLLAVAPEMGAARAAARLVVALREHCLDEAELQAVASALLELLMQTSVEVRAVLAIEIGHMPNAPSSLVEQLASDDNPAVAEGVILGSPVLDDDALLRIIRERTRGHRLAVARRPDLGEAVASALARCGEGSVLVALAGNSDTTLSRSVLAYLAAEAARFPELAAPLVHRGDLPAEIANDLLTWVTEVAIEEAVASGISGRVAIEAGRRANARLRRRATPECLDALAARAVAAAAEEGQLGPGFVLDALRGGAEAAAIAALSRLSHVPVEHARECAASREAGRVAALCRAAGLSWEEFQAVAGCLGMSANAAMGAPPREQYEITPERRAAAAVMCRLQLVWGSQGLLKA